MPSRGTVFLSVMKRSAPDLYELRRDQAPQGRRWCSGPSGAFRRWYAHTPIQSAVQNAQVLKRSRLPRLRHSGIQGNPPLRCPGIDAEEMTDHRFSSGLFQHPGKATIGFAGIDGGVDHLHVQPGDFDDSVTAGEAVTVLILLLKPADTLFQIRQAFPGKEVAENSLT